jgi:hypothetical protein
MAAMPIYSSQTEASWLRSPASSSIDELELEEARPVPSGRRWRRKAVRVLGWMCIAGFCAVDAWMVTSTAARDAMASWSTMGKAVPPRGDVTGLAGTAREGLVPNAEPTAEAVVPGPAEIVHNEAASGLHPRAPTDPSAAPVAAPEPSLSAPKLHASEPARDKAVRRKVDPTEDPYAGAAPRRQDPTEDPYQ